MIDLILNVEAKPSFERMVRLLGNLTEEQQRSIENYIKGFEAGIQAGIQVGKAAETKKFQV
ncbi:hypothetical protein [Lysinibacillus fusiformis]|uniref:hypothetical protein n=1 Tax=Lysinibacillus fusiformis TaxID=28031 RepID=UPI00119F1265|nr:hypothetical protein [Lysinibacillus fusiformis]